MHKTEFLNTFIPLKNKWYRYAIWVLEDTLESEDVVQELYVKLWNMRTQLPGYSNLEALAFKMLKNLCIDRLRRVKVYKEDLDRHGNIAGGLSSSDLVETKDASRILSRIVRSLPETQRLVLQLKHVEGHSISEIARLLEMTTNAVNVNLSRARHKIKEQYTKWISYESKSS
ncbi:MAG: RNA polymerase sigma factor [Roseivirga sp.]|nr:RNA polymerase sigma factor [Roseivirga sp.]